MPTSNSSDYQPLLNNKLSYFEGCEACKLEKRKQRNTGYPKEFLFVGLVVLCNALPISSLFPFLYYMVKDFNVAKSASDIGTYAGILASSFMVGRFIFSVLWGVAADRYGRKPVIFVGAVSIIIFNTMFGVSVNYWMAILTRFALGSFNGLIGTIKAYITEVSRPEHHATGMSIVTTMWGVGLIIGPAIGGFLALPAQKYPNIFSEDSFWGRFPYFLPCVVISAFAVPLVPLSLLLPETLHKHPAMEEENPDLNAIGGDIETEVTQNEKTCMKENRGGDKGSLKSILNNWPVMSSIIVICIYSLHDIAYSEIFSLWALSPRTEGGLGFTTSQVGAVLSISGFGLLVIQLATFSPLTKLFGPICLIRAAAVVSIPLLTAYPFIAMLRGTALWIVINCASLLKFILSMMITAGAFLLLNNATSQHERAAANGIEMSGMSLFKAIGPAAAGVIFSWGQKRQKSHFLPGFHMVCFVLNLFVVIFIIMTSDPILPRSTNKPLQESYVEPEKQQLEEPENP